MNRIFAAFTTVVAITLSAPAAAAPEIYNIDGTHTFPRFEYVHFGYSNQVQRFDKTVGIITLDRAARTGSVNVSIDVNSINSGFEVFNVDLKGAEFFDVEKFPTITFKSDSVRFEGNQPKIIEGTLTIKGVAKPVALTLLSFHCMPHPMLKKDACGSNAQARIKRSDFNMGKFVPYVSDEVTLTIAVEAIRQ